MDLVQSVRKEGSRGSRAIGQNVDIESIRNSSRRENYLGHSIIARVGRSERKRDPDFWMRNSRTATSGEAESDRLKEIREIQLMERTMMMNKTLGRPLHEGVDATLAVEPPSEPVAQPTAVGAGCTTEHDSRDRHTRHGRHDHDRRRHRHRRRSTPRSRSRSGSPRRRRLQHHRSQRSHSHEHRHRHHDHGRDRDEPRQRHPEIRPRSPDRAYGRRPPRDERDREDRYRARY